MEYIIVTGTHDFVTNKVNARLAEGWELYGSPTVTNYTTKKTGYTAKVWIKHSQAMVKGATAWQVRK